MTYANQQDLIDRFGSAELLDVADRDDDQVVDPDVVASALADADELINSYVGKRYDLPLAATPALLTAIAADLARHSLYKDAPPEIVVENYKAAIATLKDISAGRAVLDVGGSEPAAAPANVQIQSQTKIFGRDKLTDY